MKTPVGIFIVNVLTDPNIRRFRTRHFQSSGCELPVHACFNRAQITKFYKITKILLIYNLFLPQVMGIQTIGMPDKLPAPGIRKNYPAGYKKYS